MNDWGAPATTDPEAEQMASMYVSAVNQVEAIAKVERHFAKHSDRVVKITGAHQSGGRRRWSVSYKVYVNQRRESE